jgi:hypothetical protein
MSENDLKSKNEASVPVHDSVDNSSSGSGSSEEED